MKKVAKQATKWAARKTYEGGKSAAKAGASAAGRYGRRKVDDTIKKYERVTRDNWYRRAAEACEGAGDAILRQSEGTSQRLVQACAGKLGMMGAPAAIYATATLIGTASTGTAIGSLSGAAFSSATLAWVGGSVAMGSAIVAAATATGAVAAVFGTRWALRRYVYGRKRKHVDLEDEERRILDAALALAYPFRSQESAGRRLDPAEARALNAEALRPLHDALVQYCQKIAPDRKTWPAGARRKLDGATKRLEKVMTYSRDLARQYPNFTTGLAGGVITQLLADDVPAFDDNEQLVLDALRRSNNDLTNASDEELAAYVQSLDPAQLQGLRSNLIGISHELRYAAAENSDGDQYVVELFDAANHPGADVRITNTLTGEVRELQLKATNYHSYIQEHNERYADIPAMATDELAVRTEGVESSGIAYGDVSENVDTVASGLKDVDDPSVWASMSVGGMIWLARHVNVLLRGGRASPREKYGLVDSGIRTAVITGLVHTVIG